MPILIQYNTTVKHSVFILPIPKCASHPLDILFNNHVLCVVCVS